MNIEMKHITRDSAIIVGCTLLPIFILIITNNALIYLVSSYIFGSVGYVIVGCLKKVSRFKYLAKITVIIWLVLSLGFLFGATSFDSLLYSLLYLFINMILGGSLSFLVVKAPKDPVVNDEEVGK